MSRRMKGKLKNAILKVTAALCVIALIVFACLLDSISWIPCIVCGGCALWLGLFGCANNWFEGGNEAEEREAER